MKRLFIAIIFVSLSSMIFAQDYTFSDWDSDDDGVIERFEFTTKFVTEFYPTWEISDSKGIIEDDFFENSFAGLDTDGDNMLSDEEWLLGYNYLYDDYLIYGEYDFVDSNSDGEIDYIEYNDVLYDTKLFTDIDLDADNYITEYELADYVFGNWDFDDSGTINRSEFKSFDWYYLDI